MFRKETDKPSVSVIMSTFNEKKEWVEASIQSILSQDFKDFEFIIVLDNPENIEISRLLEKTELNDNRVKLIKNRTNEGLVSCLNKAIKYSRGKYIARMDADDISLPGRLKIQYDFMENNKEIDFIGSGYIKIDENGNIINHDIREYDPRQIILESLERSPIGHPTWFVKREVYEALQGYRYVHSAEDYDFVCRAIASGYKVQCLKQSFIKYRVRESGISRSNNYTQRYNTREISRIYFKSIKKNMVMNSFNANFLCQRNKIKEKRYREYGMNNLIIKNSIKYKRLNLDTLLSLYQFIKFTDIFFEEYIYKISLLFKKLRIQYIIDKSVKDDDC